MDGLPLFIGHTWEKIRTQKELNLPDQRVMVASLRCGELKDESLILVGPAVHSLKEDTDRRVIADFQEKCTSILKQALSHYDEFAHQYDKTIYDKNRKDMTQHLMNQQLYLCFESQLK